MSGKRNNLEDFVIVELECSRVLRSDDGERDPLPRPSRIFSEYLFDTAEDQFLGRTAFGGRATLQAPIDRIRDVDRRSHKFSLAYLWSINCLSPSFDSVAQAHPILKEIRNDICGQMQKTAVLEAFEEISLGRTSPCSEDLRAIRSSSKR